MVGKARNGEEAIALVKQHHPNICIMDIEMRVKNGIDTAEELKDNPCKIIILTTFARAGYFEQARKAEVFGYLLKDSPSQDLVNSIRIIMAGRRIYAPELVDMAYSDQNPLTEREDQVIKLVADGKNTKEIAGQLDITTGTVRNYISVILDKLEVSNRVEAVSRIKEKGWLK